MPIPLNMRCYNPGAGGVFSTANPITDLRSKADTYMHSISDRFGFETCVVGFYCRLPEAKEWIRNGLMRSLVVSGPGAQTVWEGYLETVTVTVGQKKASVSIRPMANIVRYLWTTIQGTPGDTPIPATANSTLARLVPSNGDSSVYASEMSATS